MKKWILKNKLVIIGVFFGALAGYVYWKYVGCLTGTCAITSSPIRSTIYFAVVGGLIFSYFKQQPKMQPPTTNYNDNV